MLTILNKTDYDGRVEALRGTERQVKQAVGFLAVQALAKVIGADSAGDIDPANRLLKAVSPANRRAVTLFFQDHTGYKFEEDGSTFGRKRKLLTSKNRGEQGREALTRGVQFLADIEKANAANQEDALAMAFWDWYELTTKSDVSEYNPKESIKKAFKKALTENAAIPDIIAGIVESGFDLGALSKAIVEAPAQARAA